MNLKTLYLKQSLTLIFFLQLVVLYILNFAPVNAQSWQRIDSISPYVNSIYFPINQPSNIIVSSDEFPTIFDVNPVQFPIIGNGYRISTDSGKNFSAVKLGGYSVYEFTQDPNTFQNVFASAYSLKLGGIAISKDGGSTWNTTVLKCQSTSQPLKLIYKSDTTLKFFGAVANTHYGFFTYSDTFKFCTPIEGIEVQSRDIAISPKDSSLMFLAADGVYTRGVYRTYDYGSTWLKDEQGLDGINVLCIMPSPLDPAVILCGSGSPEGGIYKSIDTGKTWQRLPYTSGKVYSIVQHPLNPKFMIAACGLDGIWASGSYGGGWEPIGLGGLPDGFDVRKVALPPWENTGQGYIAFAAIDSGGLYRSQPLITSVDDRNDNQNGLKSNISVYPQPATDRVEIQFLNSKGGNVKIEIKDCLGKSVGIIQNGFMNEGIQNILWNIPPNISENIYYAIIKTSEYTECSKILIVH